MDGLLHRYLTPTAILTDSRAEADAVEARLRAARPPLKDMIASIRSYDDLVPPDATEKAAEVAVIRRKLTPNIRAEMTKDDRDKLERLIGRADQSPAELDRTFHIAAADVPDVLTRGLRERDGAVGRTILVYPNPASTWWRGETITTFVGEMRAAAQAPVALGGRPARVAGGPALSADIIASMEHDGPLASGLAFAGVALTVLLLFRRGLATPFVIGSLIVGVLWLLALSMRLGIKINFVNFIAFPITFGIGVDYAVNVMGRYLRDGGRSVAAAVRGTAAPSRSVRSQRSSATRRCWSRRTSACSCSACSPCWARSPAWSRRSSCCPPCCCCSGRNRARGCSPSNGTRRPA